jgi:hypothetical protein
MSLYTEDGLCKCSCVKANYVPTLSSADEVKLRLCMPLQTFDVLVELFVEFVLKLFGGIPHVDKVEMTIIAT